MTQRLVYLVDREPAEGEELDERQMSYGIRANPGLLTLGEFALERARDFRARHAYHGGAFTVYAWPERPGEHHGQDAPDNAAMWEFPEDWPMTPARDLRTGSPLWTPEQEKERAELLRDVMRGRTKAELLSMAYAGGLVRHNSPEQWRKDEIAVVVRDQQWDRSHPRPARGSAPVGFHERRP